MKKINGFTLVELMVTLAVAAILMTVAIPSFQNTIRMNRLSTQTSHIMTALNIARSEAIRRGVSVSVCSSLNSTACRSAATAGNWSGGWIVFSDINGDGDVDVDDGVLKVWNALSGAATLTETNNSGTSGTISYSPRCMADTTIAMDLTFPHCGTNEKRTISVARTVHISSKKEDC